MADDSRGRCGCARQSWGRVRLLRTVVIIRVLMVLVAVGPAVVVASETSPFSVGPESADHPDPRLAVWFALDRESPEAGSISHSTGSWLPPPLAETSPCETTQWLGAGNNLRWSNPENWSDGRVPEACSTVVLGSGGSDSMLDPDFGGSVAGLVLAEGFNGTLWLARDLRVEGTVEVFDGAIEQGPHRIAAMRLEVDGGALIGGSAPIWIEREAMVNRGIVKTPSSLMRVESMMIDNPGVVRMGRYGKLEIAGDADSLRGDGYLDTRSYTPNSIEYTGNAASDLTEAGPLKDYPAFGQVGAALDLPQDEDVVYVALMDAAAGYMYLGTNSSPGYVVKVRLSDFSRVGAIALDPSDGDILSGVIDVSSGQGFAYFGTEASPARVVKVDLATFQVTDVLTLATGENSLLSAVIDPAAGYAYFATSWTPGKIVRISLATFSRDSVLDVTATAVVETRDLNRLLRFADDPRPDDRGLGEVRQAQARFGGYGFDEGDGAGSVGAGGQAADQEQEAGHAGQDTPQLVNGHEIRTFRLG